MRMNSRDWQKLWIPLVAELVMDAVLLILGKTETKTRIYTRYKGGYNERNNDNNAGIFNSSGFRVRW